MSLTATSRFEQRVARAVDDAHAAASELPEDLVAVGELRADQSGSSVGAPEFSRYDSGMQDFEKLGAFYLGKAFDLAKKTRKDDLLLYDSRDLVTHAVCVGMTGSGKTGLCLSLHRRGRDRRRAGHPDRPEGRPLQPAAHLSRPCARGLPPVDQRGGCGAQGVVAGRLREAAGRDLEEGPGRVGRGRRAHPADEGRRGFRDLHARLDGGPAGVDPEVVLGAGAGRPGGRRDPARAGRLDDDRAADAARRRRRSAQEPRAHPRLDGPGRGLAEGRGPRPRGADRPHPESAVHEGRRRRARVVLSGQGPLRAGDEPEQPAGGAGLLDVARGRAARDRADAALEPRASRASRSSRSRTWRTRSACSS